VVAESDGVVKLSVVAAALVRSNVPPVNALYQRNIPEVVLVAVRETVPVPHLDRLVTVGTTAAVPVLTVAVTAVRGVFSQLAALLKVT
jgi:hypothetical protein